MKKIKVGAYCRVSTDDEDQQDSYQSQKLYFENYIKNHENWKLKDIYADEGVTGTITYKRDDFNRMIEDARNGELDLIITKEVSRFARNTVDTLQHTRDLKELGIGVMFIIDNINTLDSDGELRLTLMASIAQEESRKTSERVKWGQKRKMEQGVVFGRDLLGYTVEDGKMYINEEEAEIVKLIYHKYLHEEKGAHTIARELYEAGITAKRVKKWSNTQILRVLRNEKYVGDLLQQKTITPNYLTHKKKYNRGEAEMVYIKDHHEPIIDRETWDAVQKEMKRRSPTKEQKNKHSNRYWCSGKLICARCGTKLTTRQKKLKNGEVYRAWRCLSAIKHGTKKIDVQGNEVGCDLGQINHIVLGNVVGYVLKSVNKNKEKITSELIREIQSVKQHQIVRNTEPLKNKIKDIEKKKKKIIDSMVEELISKSDMKLMNEKYDDEIKEIEDQIDAVESINFRNKKRANNIQSYVDRINELVNLEGEKEEIYKQTVDKIIFYERDFIEVHLHCMPTPIKIKFTSSGRNGKYKMTYEFVE